jgi:hypothetical protein
MLYLLNRTSRHEDVLGEWRYSSTHSLTSALDGGEWSVSRPSRFIPREIAPGTHWRGGWVGLRAVVEATKKQNFSRSSGSTFVIWSLVTLKPVFTP